MPEAEELRLKLVWVSIFRVVATTVLLGATATRLLSGPPALEFSREDSLSFVIIGVVFFLTAIYGLYLRAGRNLATIAWAQVLGDVVLATSLVYVTGGIESPFAFSYLLAVILASIVLFQRGALVTAAAGSLAFSTLSLLVHFNILRPPSGAVAVPIDRLGFVVISNVLAQFLVAVLVAYLGGQLSSAGLRLSAREADLRHLAALQRQILACMPSGLITCDGDGQVTFMNPAAAAILECDQMRAPLLGDLIPGVLQIEPGARRTERAVQTKSGERVLGSTVTRLEHSPGAVLVVFQDLTQLRRAEHELRRADQLAALGKLSAQLAHEIRNPLASMRGSAQLIAAESAGNDTAGRLSHILVREADRLSKLLDEFLRFARPPAPSRRSCMLNELVAETVDMLKTDPLASRVHVALELAPVSANVDPDQLRQVLLNLLRNAFAAVPADGQIKVTAARGPAGSEIRVWDSGGGIPEEHLPRLFEPFFSTREGGTGLGLSTAYSIVRAHGGTIRATSCPPSGTEFLVVLPEGSA